MSGEFTRMTAGCFGNGQAVMPPSSLISAMGRRSGGSSLDVPMNRCTSHHSRVVTSLQFTTVRDRKALVIMMSSRGLLTNWSSDTTHSFGLWRCNERLCNLLAFSSTLPAGTRVEDVFRFWMWSWCVAPAPAPQRLVLAVQRSPRESAYPRHDRQHGGVVCGRGNLRSADGRSSSGRESRPPTV